MVNAGGSDGVAENFGWPCYEGDFEHSGYQNNVNTSDFCMTLTAGDVDPPWLAWHHSNPASVGFVGNAASGSVFYDGASFPPTYAGRFFFYRLQVLAAHLAFP